MPIMLRSSGWMPMSGSVMKNPAWVNNFLIPQLNKATQLTWTTNGDMLKSSECVLKASDRGGIIKANKVLQQICELYPCIDEEDIGYRYERYIGCNKYLGFWALNIDKIHIRGAVYGQDFGI